MNENENISFETLCELLRDDDQNAFTFSFLTGEKEYDAYKSRVIKANVGKATFAYGVYSNKPHIETSATLKYRLVAVIAEDKTIYLVDGTFFYDYLDDIFYDYPDGVVVSKDYCDKLQKQADSICKSWYDALPEITLFEETVTAARLDARRLIVNGKPAEEYLPTVTITAHDMCDLIAGTYTSIEDLVTEKLNESRLFVTEKKAYNKLVQQYMSDPEIFTEDECRILNCIHARDTFLNVTMRYLKSELTLSLSKNLIRAVVATGKFAPCDFKDLAKRKNPMFQFMGTENGTLPLSIITQIASKNKILYRQDNAA